MHQTLTDLQFWRGASWRRNTLFLALAGMEMAWFTPLVMSLLPRSWGDPPVLYLLGLWGIMLVMMAAAHFMSTRQIDSPAFELGVLATIVIMGLLVLRFYVFWDEPLFSLGWIKQAFFEPSPRRLETLVVLATMGYLWWRGVTFLQRDVGFFIIGYDFRKGMLGLIFSLILFTGLSGQTVTIFVYFFFFFSLMAVALGRVEDKIQVARKGERSFGIEWLGVLTLCSLGVMAMIAIFSIVWSRNTFGGIAQALAPAGSVVGRIVGSVLLFLLSLLEPFLQWLIAFIRAGLGPQAVDGPLIETPPSIGEMLGVDETGELAGAGIPPWMDILINYILPAAIVIGVLILLVFWLERHRRKARQQDDSDQRARVDGVERAGIGGLMEAGLNRLREFAGLVGAFGLGRRFYAAISIRHIYGNVQHLAKQRGYPRHKAQTPNDYLPTLQRVFPGQEEALAHITDAYNAYEYGEVTTDPEELERLRSDWQSVRETAKQHPPADSNDDSQT